MAREPLATNVIGFIDGVSIHVECNYSMNEQAAAYNGHTKDTICNNVLAFSHLWENYCCVYLFFQACGMISMHL